MVAAVMRSFLRACDASRACTTSISICPSLRWLAGAASCARPIAPLKATTAAQAKAWGKSLLNNGLFILVSPAYIDAGVACLDGESTDPSHLETPALRKSSAPNRNRG